MFYKGIKELYPKINKNIAKYIALCRPFTLIAPVIAGILGILIERIYSNGNWQIEHLILAPIVIALIQVVGQVVNQITDIEQDRINKPYRPIVQEIISINNAWIFTTITSIIALLISLYLGIKFTFISSVVLFFAYIYSVEPIRIKKRSVWAALLWMSLSRGMLPFLLTWSLYNTLLDNLLPWQLGLVATMWVFTFQSTKDFPDYQGDYECNIPTLVTKYHQRIAVDFISLMFCVYLFVGILILPFPLMFALIPNTFIGISIIILLKNNTQLKKFENNAGWMLFYGGIGIFYISILLLL